MTKKITIVQLNTEDWQEYKKIRLESLQKEPKAFNSKFEEESAYSDSYWKEKLVDKAAIFAFAKFENQFVGVMHLTYGEQGEDANVAVVHGAYVNEDFRGLGVGKLLLNFLINVATKNNEINLLKLWVKEYQTSAVGLYLGLGFRTVSKIGEYTLIMEKVLD